MAILHLNASSGTAVRSTAAWINGAISYARSERVEWHRLTVHCRLDQRHDQLRPI